MRGAKITKITATIMLLFLALTLVGSAAAYVIDGDLDDWGVHPTNDWYADSPTAVSVVENWPSGPNPGNNPGIEQCDIEAMYVDEDVNGSYIYFAIITSMPPEGCDYYSWSRRRTYHLIPGDLALDFDGDGYFEYGVKLTNDSRTVLGDVGDVFKNPEWELLDYEVGQCLVSFSNIVNGTKIGEAEIVYKQYNDWNWDNGAVNYVIEMKVSKTTFGIYGEGYVDLLATVSCANDVIEIKKFHYTGIPEFTTMAVPAGAILGFVYAFRRKRKY